MAKFTGTGVAVVTPFDANRKIDTVAIHNIVNHLVAGKIDFLVVLGSTGEAATISKSEKDFVIETFLQANNGRLPVVLGVGGNDTREVAESCAYYSQKFDIQGILSASPHYNKPSQEGIYRHYKALSESTEKPFIVYNVPGRTASNISAETTLRIAADLKNMIAIKESSGNLEQMAEIIASKPADFTLLSGDDPLAVPVLSIGGEGLVSVIGQAEPLRTSDMVRAGMRGDFAEAKKLHYELLHLTKLAFAEGNPAGIKMILEVMGLCESWVRLPLVEGSDSLRQKIRAELAKLA